MTFCSFPALPTSSNSLLFGAVRTHSKLLTMPGSSTKKRASDGAGAASAAEEPPAKLNKTTSDFSVFRQVIFDGSSFPRISFCDNFSFHKKYVWIFKNVGLTFYTTSSFNFFL